MFFFFKQKTAYEITEGDWSSDVCSSDLPRCAASQNSGMDPVGEREAHGSRREGTSDRRDVPGEEDEYEGATHHVEERDRTEPASFEDRHPPGGDTHADTHDEIEHEELDADARDVLR